MKIIYILPILVAIHFFASGQEVLSSAGQTQKAADTELSWTIGETVIETWSNPTSTLTQGFHQTRITITAISEIEWPGLKINVFPNPVRNTLNIEFNSLPEEMLFVVIDLLGKTIQRDFIKGNNTYLDFSNLADGQYILKIQTKAGKPVQTFKIVKSGI